MTAQSVAVGEERDGATIAQIVRELLDGLPWSKARDLCRSGRVRIDGARALDPAQRVKAGMRVEVEPDAPRLRAGVLEKARVIHLDADIVVVDKPPGVMTVPFEEGDRDTLADQVRAWLKRTTKARDPMVGVVQRLDKDTTGVIVFARTMSAKRALEEQMRAHTTTRSYHAIVHGHAHGGTRETMIVQDRGDGLRGSWRAQWGPVPGDAKRAVTHLKVLEAMPRATLLECRLETGRQHQIRIHVAEIGHPIVGETVYIRDFAGPRIEAPRPMLHARVLEIDHPRTGERARFEREPPDDFASCLASLRGT